MIAWLKRLLFGEPEPKGPPHHYATRGTMLDYIRGDECVYCLHRDDQRRKYNDSPCQRPYQPELA